VLAKELVALQPDVILASRPRVTPEIDADGCRIHVELEGLEQAPVLVLSNSLAHHTAYVGRSG
jgi:hypothetical protein